jgi:GrpB-like predicted nucleotidyltransferase (UPF0157 family)
MMENSMRNIIIVPYDEKWVSEFEKIKSELLKAMNDSVISVEHIGSTSVMGLWAKPVIDIDIVVEDDMFQIVKEKLETIGYFHVGDLGIAGREAFNYGNKNHLMEHHLYVCGKDSAELKRHITFRDYLRINEDDRNKYSNIKIKMAGKYPQDIDNYILGKQPVIQEIYKKCGL